MAALWAVLHALCFIVFAIVSRGNAQNMIIKLSPGPYLEMNETVYDSFQKCASLCSNASSITSSSRCFNLTTFKCTVVKTEANSVHCQESFQLSNIGPVQCNLGCWKTTTELYVISICSPVTTTTRFFSTTRSFGTATPIQEITTTPTTAEATTSSKSEAVQAQDDDDASAGIIAGVVTSLIVVTIVVIIGFLVWRRRRRNSGVPEKKPDQDTNSSGQSIEEDPPDSQHYANTPSPIYSEVNPGQPPVAHTNYTSKTGYVNLPTPDKSKKSTSLLSRKSDQIMQWVKKDPKKEKGATAKDKIYKNSSQINDGATAEEDANKEESAKYANLNNDNKPKATSGIYSVAGAVNGTDNQQYSALDVKTQYSHGYGPLIGGKSPILPPTAVAAPPGSQGSKPAPLYSEVTKSGGLPLHESVRSETHEYVDLEDEPTVDKPPLTNSNSGNYYQNIKH